MNTPRVCDGCGGSGVVECSYCDGTGYDDDAEDGCCEVCDGDGSSLDPCAECGGSGYVDIN